MLRNKVFHKKMAGSKVLYNVNINRKMSYSYQNSLFDYSDNLFLPVETLMDAFIKHLSKNHQILEQIDADMVSNKLSKTINFYEESNILQNVAEIKEVNGEYQIQISLTFCQFAWCVALFLLSYFDNCVLIPFMNALGINKQNRKINHEELNFVNDTFFKGRTLLNKVNTEQFFNMPNICDPQQFSDCINRANAVFCGGLTFVFLHEFSHNYLGHTQNNNSYEHSVNDEVVADETALDFLSDTFEGEDGYTNKAGIVIILCSLLLMGKDTISGGGSHPNMDYRIDYIMKKLNLDDHDCLWGIVGSAIRLWLMVYGDFTIHEDQKMGSWMYYRDFYADYIKQLTMVREKRYPHVCKPDWYTV